MKRKPIAELIHKARFGEVKCEINGEGIETSGAHQLVTITAGRYQSFDIADATIQELHAPNILSYRGSIIRSHIHKGQLTGLQLPEAHITDVVFNNCRLNLANFRKVKFERCIFTACDLTEADFSDANMHNALFENCQIDLAEFSNVQCKRVEFLNTNLSQIKGVGGLSGSAITEENLIEIAPLLAASHGIHLIAR
jgi:uncharacterized protein YjbI with pentapeptide repeats